MDPVKRIEGMIEYEFTYLDVRESADMAKDASIAIEEVKQIQKKAKNLKKALRTAKVIIDDLHEGGHLAGYSNIVDALGEE